MDPGLGLETIGVDEVEVEALFWTSIGGVARLRARGEAFLVREGDRLADGDIDSIGFASPRLGWSRLRRRNLYSPEIPYRPLVWLVSGGAGDGVERSQGAEEGGGYTLDPQRDAGLQVLRLRDDAPLILPPPRWRWDLDAGSARRWSKVLAEGAPTFRFGFEPVWLEGRLAGSRPADRPDGGDLRVVVDAPFGSLAIPVAAGEAIPDGLWRAIVEQRRLGRDRVATRRFLGHPTRRPYRRDGRRDPFVDPFLAGRRGGLGPWSTSRGGLWQQLIDEIEIGAVFRSRTDTVVEVRAGTQSIPVRPGDELWDGEVVAIDPREGVEFRQSVSDPTALRPFRRRVLRPLPGTPGWFLKSWTAAPTPDPFLPLAGVAAEEPTPSALADRFCGSLFHRELGELDAVLDRARVRFERYRWERSLGEGAYTGGEYLQAVEQAVATDLARLLGGSLRRLESLTEVVEPSPAEILGLLGDLRLVAGRPTAAAEAYRAAESLSPSYSPLCGRLHGGRLFGAEGIAAPRSGGRRWLEPTHWLHVWDPDTGASLGRHLLPALPEAFTVVGGELQIALFGGGEFRPVGDSTPAAERVVQDLGPRRSAVRAGAALARNFVRDGSPRFAVGRRFYDHQAVTLEELEADLRAAVLRDPHVPWHRFFFGQTLWAQGRHAEAEALWRVLWEEVPQSLPFYEQLWMAAFHDGYGQTTWADHGYGVALATRSRLPQPIVAQIPQARYELISWLDGTLRERPERRLLAWQRLQEILGPTWGDFVIAALWTEELERQGRVEEARKVRARADRAAGGPWDPVAHAAWVDYGLYGLLAALAALWARLVIPVGRWFRRRSADPESGRGSEGDGGDPRGVHPQALVASGPLRLGRDLLALGLTLVLATSLVALALTSLAVAFEIPEQHLAEDSTDVDRARLARDASPARLWRALLSGGVYDAPGGDSPRWLLTLDASGWDRGQAMVLGILGSGLGLALLALPAGWLATRRRSWRFVRRWCPGVVAARRGRDLEASLQFGVFVFALLPLLWLSVALPTGIPTPGWVSANVLTVLGEVLLEHSLLPLPEESAEVAEDQGGVWETTRHRELWVIMRAFPGADIVGGLVLCVLGLGLVSSVRAHRRGVVP